MFNNIKIGERGGTGIPKIWTATKDAEYPTPILTDSFNPDITELTVFIKKNKTYNTSASNISLDSNLTEQEQIIVDYIKQYGSIRRVVVEEILGVKQRRANLILSTLVEKGIIKSIGNTSNLKYILF